jgi:N-methylhydantoinase A
MLKLPAIDLAEVGAGGGSLCTLDAAGAPKVGPHSAGADPGPVCYGRGGIQPTITDCNLALGYLDPAGLAGGTLPLDVVAARQAIEDQLATPLGLSPERAAYGMLTLASATMMRAIRAVSVERGRDVRDFCLLAFGGNGPLFAAGIARELGIRRVLVPPMAGLFSAFGLLLADTEHHASRSPRTRTPDVAGLRALIDELTREVDALLAHDGFPPARRQTSLTARARYRGQSSELPVPLDGFDAATILGTLPEAFAEEHQRSYGFRAPAGEPIELVGLAVVGRGLPERPRLPDRIPPAMATVPASRRVWFPATGWVDASVMDRAALAAGARQGPLIVQEYDATCLAPPGARASLDEFGMIVLDLS